MNAVYALTWPVFTKSQTPSATIPAVSITTPITNRRVMLSMP